MVDAHTYRAEQSRGAPRVFLGREGRTPRALTDRKTQIPSVRGAGTRALTADFKWIHCLWTIDRQHRVLLLSFVGKKAHRLGRNAPTSTIHTSKDSRLDALEKMAAARAMKDGDVCSTTLKLGFAGHSINSPIHPYTIHTHPPTLFLTFGSAIG